jgi:hypothetical protein
MSITALFKRLDAPLKNPRRSWGSEASNGTIFLRVWQGETIRIGGKAYVRLTDRHKFEGNNNFGYEERLVHIERIRKGASVYCIFCEPVDPAVEPKTIKAVINTHLFPGLNLIEHARDAWLEFSLRVPIEPFFRTQA